MRPGSLTPAALRAGDHVAVVAPSGPVLAERLSRGVATLASWDLVVEVMPHVLASVGDGMFAGTDAERAADFENAWCRTDVKAVMCARGGYGASRIIDLVDWQRIRAARPRWLVGSSDVTALHEVIHRRLGLATLYGPMTASEIFAGDSPDTASVAALRRALFDQPRALSIVAHPAQVITAGQASGPLVGGNLSLIAAGIGTPDSAPATGAIAFLEDVGEQPYRIDRLLTQLLRSGWLDDVRGVILGTFHRCGDVESVLQDRLGGLGVPVVGGFPVGHGPVQYTLPLGLNVTVDSLAGMVTADA